MGSRFIFVHYTRNVIRENLYKPRVIFDKKVSGGCLVMPASLLKTEVSRVSRRSHHSYPESTAVLITGR